MSTQSAGGPTTPGRNAVIPQRHPNAAADGEEIPSHYRHCFGCGIDHPDGLHMRVFAGPGLTVHGVFVVGAAHQGAPGLAHGGLLAAAFDEALGALNWLLLHPAVTARLETDFKRPIPVGTTLHLDAEIVGVDGRKVYTRGIGRAGTPDGPVALTAAGLFIQVPVEHFTSHGRSEDVAAAWAERGDSGALDVNP